MSTVSVNDKIKNALNLYNQALQQDLAGKYQGKVAGKDLSTNDFTDELKTKLEGIDTSDFVQTETGKSLSTNDFTDSYKDKLDSVATETYVTKVNGKDLSTNDFTNAYKTALDGLDNTFAKKTDIARVFKNKGSVEKFENLPTENLSDGDVYNIKKKGGTDRHGIAIKAGDNVVYVAELDANESGWDVLSGAVDLSDYVQKDGSKVLSTNDFSDADKTKLDSVATDTYVLKVAGKGLSTNDFSDSYKTKLDGIETGAQENIIEGISINGTAATIDTDTKVASLTIPTGGLRFVISSTKPAGTNILWLDTSKYEN